MRKILFTVVLSASLLSLLLTCSKKSDMTIRYEMEKKLDEIEHLKSQMSIKGQQLSDSNLNSLVKEYESVAKMTSLPGNAADTLTANEELKKSWHLTLAAYTNIGILYRFVKDYDKAYEYFKIVAKSCASSPIERMASIFNMAKCREQTRKYVEASALYDTLAILYMPNAKPLNPNMDALDAPIRSAEMWQKIGDINKYNEKLEQGRNYFISFRDKFTGTPLENIILGKIAATYLHQKKYSQAIEIMQSAKAVGDSLGNNAGQTPPHLLMMIADVYMKNMKQFKNAEKTYRKFIKIYPQHDKLASAYLGLGLSLYQQGKYAKARKVFRNIEDMPKATAKTAAEAYYAIALCYEKEGYWEKAIGQFNVVQAAFPGSDKAFEAGLYMASYYKNKGEKKLANKTFNETELYIKRYANSETNTPMQIARAMGYLVKCYTEREDFNKAIETLTQVYNKYPQLPEGKLAPLRIADLYESILKEPNKAAQWLKIFLEANPDDEKYMQIMAHIKKLE
ncbi:MAG: tetratricopeptide repeat protein [candidate division Zixibacteria bacterium]|nr:tetratricopeptide repeat protein [candidate division Zixibacteria bacterium]